VEKKIVSEKKTKHQVFAIGSFVRKIKEKNTSAEMSHTGAEVSWCRIVQVPKCLAFLSYSLCKSLQKSESLSKKFVSTMKSIISFNYTQEHHKLWITSLREILPEKHQ
jgi:hypothetical protein